MRKAEPDYVSGRRGRYEISPPIVHPPQWVCAICSRHRKTPEEWATPFVIRARRKSSFPNSRPDSAAFARNFKRDEEARLRAAVAAAERAQKARANAVRFGTVCDAYRQHMRQAGKRYDRAASRIDSVEAFFGRERDAATIGWDEYQELLAEVSKLSPQTQRHYASTLIAMLNFGVTHRILPGPHALGKVPRPVVVKSDSPVTWTKRELAVILGPALDEFEREQVRWNARVAADKSARGLRSPSTVPLRGFCYVAYFTLMRPKNNLALTWPEISIDDDGVRGTFRLDQHKNVNKGIGAEGPLAEQLLRYLRSIRPANPAGPVHTNASTGVEYVDIRKQWNRLIAIASRMLGYELQGRKADFFTFRHTGASHLAEKTKNPILIAKMMGDTNGQTVMRHYFNLDLEFMAEMIAGWEVPEARRLADEDSSETGWLQ
jgi:integrase